MSSDDRDREREKPSWREIDARRGRARTSRDEPRGRDAERARAQQKDLALKTADALFSLEKGGHRGEALANAMRDAHGTSELPAACRAYAEEVGAPDDPALLSLFLDSGERDLMIVALEALLALENGGSLELSAGLKSQLRVLQHDRDDTIAGISEELLEGA